MGISFLYKAGWFVGLLLLQVLVLNQIHIAGCATPFLYVYFILKAGKGGSRNGAMASAFLLGLLVDIFSDTLGMNAAASVLLAFLSPLLLHLFSPRDMADGTEPSILSMGLFPFMKYIACGTLVHHGLLLSLEFFSLAHAGLLLLRIAGCTLLTLACIVAVEKVKFGS